MTSVTKQSRMSPETMRKLMAFRRHRIGFYSAIMLGVMILLSLGAELISNNRPIIVRYQGQWYSPIFNSYTDKDFGGLFDTEADYAI